MNYLKKEKTVDDRLTIRYLIVCEGERTEVNYFKDIEKKISEKYRNKIDVIGPVERKIVLYKLQK